MNSQRLDEAMDRMGVRAVLATSYENVTYVADYPSVTGRMYPQLPHWCLVPHGTLGAPILVMPIVEAGRLADLGRPARDMRLYGSMIEHLGEGPALDAADERFLALSRSASPKGALDALQRACRDLGLAGARVAVDASQGDTALQLARQADDQVLWEGAGESALLWARMVKTPVEIDRIRAAGALNQRAILRGLEAVGAGGNDLAFQQAWREEVVRGGGEPTFMMAGSGPRAGTFRPPNERTAATGDRFRWDCGLRLAGYCADTGGTAQVRAEPGARERQVYDAITAGIELAVATARPGLRVSELYRRVSDEVRARGVPQFAHPHVGHGIGVEARDIPILGPRQPERPMFVNGDFDPAIEVGMVLNVETPLSVLGEGGWQHEVTLCVHEHANELLTALHPYYRAGR